MTSERKLLTPAGPVKKIPGVHFSFCFCFFSIIFWVPLPANMEDIGGDWACNERVWCLSKSNTQVVVY